MTVEKIGKYEILDKIGEGGFGVVYHGRDPFIKRAVALKTCTSESDEMRRRFFREAEIAGNLHHPNIVTIHEFGLDGKTPYLVQEFLRGEDLDQKLATLDELPLATKLRYVLEVAQALDYAHGKGVIHRDVKPSNIRILDSGRVKVMDFGIARLKDQRTQLTQTGTTLGTVAYLSPEQLRGKEIDHRADIFSFGVVTYELMAGRRPFEAKTLPRLFYALIHEPPPPLREIAPECPESVIAVIERCLEKEAEDRYPSFAHVIADLQPLLRRQPPGASAVDPTLILPADELARARDEPTEETPIPPQVAEPAGSGPSLQLLAAEAKRAVDQRDLTAAELTLNLARREYDEEAVAAAFADLIDDIERLEAERDMKIRRAAALLGSDDEEGPAALTPKPTGVRQRRQLLADAGERIDRLLEKGRVEEAGIQVSRLRPILHREEGFRELEQRFKAARLAKLHGRDPTLAAGTESEKREKQREKEEPRPAAERDPPEGTPTPPPAPAAAAREPTARETKPISSDAIAGAADRIAAALRAGRLDRAAQELEAARDKLGPQEAFDVLDRRLRDVRRLTAVQQFLDRGQRACAAGQFARAQELALEVLKLDPAQLQARALFQRAEAGLHRRRREPKGR